MQHALGALRRLGGGVLFFSVLLGSQYAFAFETKDNDAIYLGSGSANIEVKHSNDLLEGSNTFGGLRLGLFWTVYADLGYGAVTYDDSVLINGVKKDITFRTTGPNLGLGFLIPIREVFLGAKYTVNPGNKWEQQQTDAATKTKDFGNSGSIDFESYYLFARLGRWFELGVRRDHISNSSSILTNSFGPYIALSLPLSKSS